MFRNYLHKFPAGCWEAAYWTVLAIIFGAAIRLRAQLPSIPFLDFDSWEYLHPTIGLLTQGTWNPTRREFLYPWLLEQILRIWPNFTAITVVQHSVGILSAGLLILAWHRMRIFLPVGALVNALHRVGGLIIAALYLFAAIIIIDEHTIRPEAFFVLVIAVCLCIATEFSRSIFLRSRCFGIQSSILAALLIFFSAAAYFLRPYYGFGVLCTLLPVFIAYLLIPGGRMLKISSLVCGLVLIFILLVWPERQAHSIQSAGKEYFLSESLFGSSSEMIYDLMQKDLRTLPATDPERPIVENVVRAMDRVIGRPTHRLLYAGFTRFNPDDVKNGPADVVKNSLSWDAKRINAFYYSYYFRAWKEYPLRMIGKITAQFWFFYSPPRYRIYDPEKEIDVSSQLQLSKQVLLESYSYAWTPFQNYVQSVLSLQGFHQMVRLPIPMRITGRIMNATYSVSLLFTLIAVAALQFGWLKDRSFKPASLWALYLFSYNFGMALTVSIVHVMGQRRYTYGQTPFSALSHCFALVFLLSLVPALISYSSKNRSRHVESWL